MLNASAVVPRAFACSKYVRARVTREEALLEEKRKDGRERWKNFYLLLVLCTFYEGRRGQVKKFLISTRISTSFFSNVVLNRWDKQHYSNTTLA